MSGAFNVELYSEIGRGRASPVYAETICYKGRTKETIEFVVAKAIDLKRQEDATRAVQLRHSLRHDKIVQFLNWFQCENKLYVILEYCPGGPLRDLLERDMSLPESIIKIFAYDVIDALIYLHMNGVVFNDLTPGNLLLDESGVVKLSDFAKAVQVDDVLDASDIDIDMYPFLAPEILNGLGVPSFASDLYALGCLMYTMANGAPPFACEDVTRLAEMVQTSAPMKMEDVSDEMNDLMMKLLQKDPRKRPTWGEMVKHPFWKGAVGDCFGNPFENFDEELLPPQRMFDDDSIRMAGPVSPRVPRAVDNAVEKTVEKTREDKTGSLVDLILQSPLLKQAPLATNSSIEYDGLPEVETVALPVSVAMLKSKTDQKKTVDKIVGLIHGEDITSVRMPLISWLIKQGRTPEIATNLANSTMLTSLIDCAMDLSDVQLVAMVLALFGTLVGTTRKLDAQWINPKMYAKIEQFCNSRHQTIARRAMAALGEVLSLIARNEDDDIEIPSFAAGVILNGIESRDIVVKHICIRVIANIATTKFFKKRFDESAIESALADVDYSSVSAGMLENFGICIANLYRTIQPLSMPFVVKLCKTLIDSGSSAASEVGIIIAAEVESIVSVKDAVINCFRSATGDLKTKVMAAICIAMQETPVQFVGLAHKFFAAFEKIRTGAPRAHELLMTWSINYCEGIVDCVSNGGSIELLHVVHQAMMIRQFSETIWTSKFEKKVQKIVRNTTFNAIKSEIAIEIVQCALCYQLCSIAIVNDLCRALNSQLGIVRFTVVKLVADATSQKPIHQLLVGFIEGHIVTQCDALLRDEPVIVDQTLRILSNICAQESDIAAMLAKQSTLTLIISSINDNVAALELVVRMIESGEVSLDALINARLVKAITSAMERRDGQEDAICLLETTLRVIDKSVAEAKNQQSRRALITSVRGLASVAPKVANVMLEIPKASECLCMVIRIFAPVGNQSDGHISSFLQTLATALSQGCRKPEHRDNLTKIVQTLETAVKDGSSMKLLLKDCGTLVAALKKASEYGSSSELKNASLACLRTIR